MIMRYSILILTVLLFFSITSAQQELQTSSNNDFLFDAVVFKSDSADLGRVDVYVVVPYETLEFLKSKDLYANKYNIIIEIFDSTGNKIDNKLIKRAVSSKEYFITRGGTGKFDYVQEIFHLKPGTFKLKVEIIDKISNRTYQRNRKITVLDFDKFNFSMSGILLVSSIEERNGKYIITPYISDNIGKLQDDFFLFFESYNNSSREKADFVYRILDEKSNVITTGERKRRNVGKSKQQHYLRINSLSSLPSGIYTLELLALKTSDKKDLSKEDYLAAAQRSIKNVQTIAGNVMQNIDEAIKQLRYIAYQDEIDRIKDAETTEEKKERFEQFWNKKDPSPNTDRNEAFQEYYSRIAFANRNFKSYTDGWMTDKGMVYVIFGPPYSVDKQSNYGDGRVYEIWRYRDNREFVFVDNSGFGDFRLVRPMTISEKYEYRN